MSIFTVYSSIHFPELISTPTPNSTKRNQQKDPELYFNGSSVGRSELWLTFRKQELHSAQVTLAGRHHQQGPALLVTDVDICAVLQQQLGDLKW